MLPAARTVIAAAASLAMLLPGSAGAAKAAWNPFDLAPYSLGEPGTFDVSDSISPQPATAPNGTSTIAWTRRDGRNSIVQAVRISPGGYAGAVINLSASDGKAYGPQVATAPDGTSTVTWIREAGGSDYIVQAVRIDPQGRTSRTLDLSERRDGLYAFPRVATAADGTSTITWRRSGGRMVVQAIRIDPKGRKGRVLELLSTDGDIDTPELATAPDGTSTVTWVRFGSNGSSIQTIRIGPRGSKGRVLQLDLPLTSVGDLQIATAQRGTSTITWAGYKVGTGTTLSSVRIDPRGNRSPVLELVGPGGPVVYGNRVATAPNGTSTVVWYRSIRDDDIVQAIQIDPRGKPGRLLNLSAPGEDAAAPNLSTAPNGTSTVTWSRGGSLSGIIQAVRLDPAGWRSATLDLSNDAQGAKNPRAATAPNGTSTVTWAGFADSKFTIRAVRLR